MMFLGRQFNYPVALEGALKMKEISYIHASGHPSAELKHGVIALISAGSAERVHRAGRFGFRQKREQHRGSESAQRARSSPSPPKATRKLEKVADDVIYIPPCPDYLSPLLTVDPAPTARLSPRRRARLRRGQAAQPRQERDRRVIRFTEQSGYHCFLKTKVLHHRQVSPRCRYEAHRFQSEKLPGGR